MDFLKITDFEDSDVIEVPLEDDGTLDLANITARFPGTIGLNYHKDDHVRVVKISNGKLHAPKGGWYDIVHYCAFPKAYSRTEAKENPA